ncbi:MAG: hypothetical protein HOO96_25455, partial [Polyangiaceae bacterium]|nr:hypothetical protein [Polyangiaceae bacterium]
GCIELTGSQRLSVAPCVGGAAAALTLRTAQGSAVSGTNALFSGVAALRAELVVVRPLVLSARAGLSATPARYQIAACGEEYFRSNFIGIDTSVGAGVHFD